MFDGKKFLVLKNYEPYCGQISSLSCRAETEKLEKKKLNFHVAENDLQNHMLEKMEDSCNGVG